ncbi:hypothetical protein H8S95_00725 [Pontibacter sp. KCTC 32443]|uniref:hypothetical protein n=1 Tax=Pontibacter TaxID=323449 RepID=UPI00164E34C7|nr:MULTISPECIES: hypothetical protein [Pontibacter]MBC5772573.1 hypothetical protein [Pontibacter sp. KCTC 32443]
MKNLNLCLLLFVAIFSSVVLTSCSDEEEGKSCMEELNDLAQLNYNKVLAFSNDPTPENCNAMKKTATDFFNKAKECGDADMIYAAEENLRAIEDWDCDNL